MPGFNQHVLGLHVSMHKPVVVQMRERFGDLARQTNDCQADSNQRGRDTQNVRAQRNLFRGPDEIDCVREIGAF